MLAYTSVSNSGLEHLKNLTKLESLSLDTRGVSDDGLAYLKKLKNLKHLDLFGAKVTDHGLRHISEISTLESLEVCAGGVTDAGLESIAKLRALRNLNLSQNHRITDVGLEHLSSKSQCFFPCISTHLTFLDLSLLTSLNLSYTSVGDGICSLVQKCPSLRMIGIEKCGLSIAAKIRLRTHQRIAVAGTGIGNYPFVI